MNIIRSNHQRIRLHDIGTDDLLRPPKPGEPFVSPVKTLEISLIPRPGRVMALEVLGETLYYWTDPHTMWTPADWTEWRRYVQDGRKPI